MKKKMDAFGDKKVNVPFFVPDITNSDKSAVMNALSNSLLTDGPQLRKFEDKFAKFVGSRYAIGVSNGTAALHLALKSLGLKKGIGLAYIDSKYLKNYTVFIDIRNANSELFRMLISHLGTIHVKGVKTFNREGFSRINYVT